MSQEQPAGQLIIPSVAVENDFSDLKQCDLDRRQTKILKEILSEQKPPLDVKDWGTWTKDKRFEMLSKMAIRDNETGPPYRAIAKRLQQIRKDRNLTAEKFAEMLSKPKGEEPWPDDEFKFKAKDINDLEYGNRKIDHVLGAIVLKRFDVSADWLLSGRGAPHTGTNSITPGRLMQLEGELRELQGVVNQNVGQNLINQLGETGHEKTMKAQTGPGFIMKGAVNAQLRLDVDSILSEVQYLKQLVDSQSKLLESYNNTLEAFRGRLTEAERKLSEND